MQDSSLELLLQRITSAEERVDKLYKAREFIDSVERVKQDLFSRRIYTAQFYTVPDDYYERSLEERAAMLGSRGVDQLCKTIIFENTVCDSDSCEDISYSKYYCVVVQYQAKINTTLLQTFVHEMRPIETRLAKKKFNFQFAPESVSYELSGFEHNAITPFGMRRNIPVIICSRLLSPNLSAPVIYLGGGKVNVKLSLPLKDLCEATRASIGTVSDSR